MSRFLLAVTYGFLSVLFFTPNAIAAPVPDDADVIASADSTDTRPTAELQAERGPLNAPRPVPHDPSSSEAPNVLEVETEEVNIVASAETKPPKAEDVPDADDSLEEWAEGVVTGTDAKLAAAEDLAAHLLSDLDMREELEEVINEKFENDAAYIRTNVLAAVVKPAERCVRRQFIRELADREPALVSDALTRYTGDRWYWPFDGMTSSQEDAINASALEALRKTSPTVAQAIKQARVAEAAGFDATEQIEVKVDGDVRNMSVVDAVFRGEDHTDVLRALSRKYN